MASKIEMVVSLPAIMKRREELQSQGRVVLPRDRPDLGRVGIVGIKQAPVSFNGSWTTRDEDPIEVDFFPFGQELLPKQHTDLEDTEIESMLNVHGKHEGFRSFREPLTRQIGFLCYCKARSMGLCLIYTVSVSVYKDLREDIRSALWPSEPPAGN